MMEPAAVLKVVLVGPSGAGKTTLRHQYTSGTTGAAKPTIGVEFSTRKESVRGSNYTMQLWDTAGSKRFAPVTDSAYLHCDAIVGVVDLDRAHKQMMAQSKRAGVENMEQLIEEYFVTELERIRHALSKVADEINRPTLVVVGNKIDLLTQGEIKYEEVAIRNALKVVAESEMRGSYFDVSALTGAGVAETFSKALDGATRRYEIKYGIRDKTAYARERPIAPQFPVDLEHDDDDESPPSWTFHSRSYCDDDAFLNNARQVNKPWWRAWLCGF